MACVGSRLALKEVENAVVGWQTGSIVGSFGIQIISKLKLVNVVAWTRVVRLVAAFVVARIEAARNKLVVVVGGVVVVGVIIIVVVYERAAILARLICVMIMLMMMVMVVA